MTPEENIKQELENKFPYLKEAVLIKRQGRMFLDVPQPHFFEVFDYLVKDLNFSHLCTITGIDEVNTFGVIYHLNKDGKIILNLKIHISHDEPKIKSVTSYFLEADAYERELIDLLGIQVEGLSPGSRYPLPDNWPKDEHPLRKDWKPKEVENA